jgi:DNA invertase Pin-like site-specific DNA recombinase
MSSWCTASAASSSDQFQLEFYVRRLAKNGVRLVSITQELGDDPMSNMIRQIMALFDEYQSKENAKHTLRAMKENARQGFWNGSLPPIGYRIVEAAEQHGHRTKKTLEIDPIQAETVRMIFRLAREGDGTSGPMGVKSIAKHLNAAGIRTRDGGRWGLGAVHNALTRTTYIGRHKFNTKFWKTRERKPEAEVVEMITPSIIDAAEFKAVQALLKSRRQQRLRTGGTGQFARLDIDLQHRAGDGRADRQLSNRRRCGSQFSARNIDLAVRNVRQRGARVGFDATKFGLLLLQAILRL